MNTDKDDAIRELAAAVADLDLTEAEKSTLIWAGNTWEPYSTENLANVIRKAHLHGHDSAEMDWKMMLARNLKPERKTTDES